MAGLRNICKQYGKLKVNGVMWLWDYANDAPRLESEMTKEEKSASEKARWNIISKELKK